MDMVLLLGVVTGMRCMTAAAALCWAAWLGLVPVHGPGMWVGYLLVAIVLTFLALGEYVVDTLPKTPRRTEFGPAVARVVVGGLVGAFVARAIDEPLAGGVIFGGVGAVIGTWGGFFVRMTMARIFRRDLPAALLETASAIALAVIALMKVHHGIVLDLQKATS